jgi:hypothetical protein
MDTIRILRVIEYVGPRDLVEAQVAQSIHGEKRITPRDGGGREVVIKAATLGAYPEILEQAQPETIWIGTDCALCGLPQFATPSGVTCNKGHGGA